MKRSRFWLSALTAALLIGWSCFHWGSSAAQAQQTAVNDAFTIAAEQCLTASSPQAALTACDRAIGINDEDPIPWYGKAEAHKSLNQERQTQIALVQFDFIGRYYGAMLQTVQGLQRRLIIKDLVDNDEQVVALQNQIRQAQTVLNNSGASQDERNEARARIERLNAIQEIYNEAKDNPQLLDDWLNNTTEAMIGLRKDFVAARARLAAEQ